MEGDASRILMEDDGDLMDRKSDNQQDKQPNKQEV